MKLNFAKKHPEAVVPKYMTAGAACFDIYAVIDEGSVTIEPGQSVQLHTGLVVEVEEGWRLDVYGRSGLWFKAGIRLGNCVGKIDNDYRDEIMVSLHNEGAAPFVIKHHDRIAQGELNMVTRVEFVERKLEELSKTARGEGGLGSTGVGI